MKWNYIHLLLIILIIIIIGIIHLPFPFYGDQAFFMLGAKEINEGMVLYKDFWDVKQPAIFFFYLIAGKMFGFTEVGVHIFELIYWIGFSVVLIWFLKRIRAFSNEAITYLAPLLIVGTYYGFGNYRLFTQVEALVNFPLLLTIAFNYLYLEKGKHQHLWIFLSGVMGGIVLLFKLIFAPILLAFWGYLFFHHIITTKNNFLKELKVPAFIGLGTIAAWIPFFVYSYQNDIIPLCYETFVKYPPQIIKHGERKTFAFLLHSIRAFADSIIFFIPISLFSILLRLKGRTFPIILWLWLLTASILILLQTTSWYPYQFQILYVPFILLALIGVDFLFEKADIIKTGLWTKNTFIIKLFLIATLGYPALYSTLSKVKELKSFNFGITHKDRIAFSSLRKENREAYEAAICLNQLSSKKCPVFVINDPTVYYYAGRNQAIAQSGWSMQLFIPGQMELLINELKEKKPCFIFISSDANSSLEKKGTVLLTWIKNNYTVASSDKIGNWYKLNSTY